MTALIRSGEGAFFLGLAFKGLLRRIQAEEWERNNDFLGECPSDAWELRLQNVTLKTREVGGQRWILRKDDEVYVRFLIGAIGRSVFGESASSGRTPEASPVRERWC
jgi:hypothetical protein